MNSDPKKPLAIPKVLVDFNNADIQGRLRLNCNGTIKDLENQHIELQENMKLLLYMEELECEGKATYSNDEKIWVAKIDWEAINRI